MMLASVYLGFEHPFSGNFVEIRAARGQDFDAALDVLEPYACPMSYGSLVL
jgi:hypothetical protein